MKIKDIEFDKVGNMSEAKENYNEWIYFTNPPAKIYVEELQKENEELQKENEEMLKAMIKCISWGTCGEIACNERIEELAKLVELKTGKNIEEYIYNE
jgi:intergrase/recombinase